MARRRLDHSLDHLQALGVAVEADGRLVILNGDGDAKLVDRASAMPGKRPELAYPSRVGQGNYESLARENEDFRRVLETGEHAQLVAMTIQPGEEIGAETHEGDQILFFVEGEGEAVLDGRSSPVGPGDYVFVPAGTLHNFVNMGSEPLRLLTTYAPPEHPHGTVHRTKAEADAAEEH